MLAQAFVPHPSSATSPPIAAQAHYRCRRACYEENGEGGFTSGLSTSVFDFFAPFFASFFAFLISFFASFFAFLISFFLCFDFFPFPAIAFSRAADDFNYITPALQDLIPPLQRANIDFERSSFVAVSCRQTRAAGL